MGKEICHVCGKEKKPYVVFLNDSIFSYIHHEQAREKGPICQRCDQFFAMTGEFKDATDEEFELTREANIFAHEMKNWWEKDKKLSEEDNSREWEGTFNIAKWFMETHKS